jgi:hypothetical protein
MDTNVCIVDNFEDLEDPRIFTLNKTHQLLEIVTISILAVLSGAEGWADSGQASQAGLWAAAARSYGSLNEFSRTR